MIQVALRVYRLQLYVIFSGFTTYVDDYSVWKTSNRVWDRISCKCILPLVISSQSGETWESIVMKEKAPGLGVLNRFAAAILGAIIMYEIEHVEMWAFVQAFRWSLFNDCEFSLCKYAGSERRREEKGTCFEKHRAMMRGT